MDQLDYSTNPDMDYVDLMAHTPAEAASSVM